MIKNIEHPHLIPLVDNEISLEAASWSMTATPIMTKSFETKDNRQGPGMSSVVSISGDSVTHSNSAQETKPRSSVTGGGRKGKTETKTPRKRGRPKGKKTASHPLVRRPKRPLSGYNLFFKDQREQLVKKAGKSNGNSKFAELAKTIGARWKAMDEATRRIYESRGAAEMKIYKVDMKEYNQKIKELSDDVDKTTKSTDTDNGSVSDLSLSHHAESDSVEEEVNHQADVITSIKASATSLDNNDDMILHDPHENHCTNNEAQDTQSSLSQDAATLDINHLLTSPITEINFSPSFKKQFNEVYTTPELSSDVVTSSEIVATCEPQQEIVCWNKTTDANGSGGTSEFTFDLIDDDALGIDMGNNSVPDASFLVFNTQF